MAGVLLRVVLIVALTAGAAILADRLGVEGGVPVRIIFFGSLFFFMAPYLDFAGVFVRGHYVSQETPGCVWRAAGIVLWIIAVIVFCFELSAANRARHRPVRNATEHRAAVVYHRLTPVGMNEAQGTAPCVGALHRTG